MTTETVAVWLIRTDLPDPLLAELERLLDDAERERAEPLCRTELRRRFVAAHGAVRIIVGQRLRAAPAGLRWRTGPHGKPDIALPPTSLQMSLSHSGELAMLALSDRRRVGADIQQITDGLDVARMSARFYPADEARYVTDGGPGAQVSRFVRLWTRKEACLKVAGGRLIPGLRLPVQDTGSAVFGDPLGPLPGPYLVKDVAVPRGFYASVAMEGCEPYRVRTLWWPARASGQAEPASA